MPYLGPDRALIFRITHIKNIPWILDNGLWSLKSDKLDPKFYRIGMPGLIEKRRDRAVDVAPGGTLGDYIPFYFTPWSMMLFKILTGHEVKKEMPDDIIFLVASLRDLAAAGYRYLYTDRYAYLTIRRCSSNPEDLATHVDWDLLRSRDFQMDPDNPSKTEKYQAEALLFEHIGLEALLGMACYSERVRELIEKELAKRKLRITLAVRRGWYF